MDRKSMLYPLLFKEIYKKKIWGGSEIRKVLKKRKCPPKTGESWEIAYLGKDVNKVANGSFKGWSLGKLIEKMPQEILGDELYMKYANRFPLIVKFLEAKERLSLQVHPSDEYAQLFDAGANGKTEAWYVISAPEGAKAIRGVLPGTLVSEFKEKLKTGSVEECLNTMTLREGDVIFMPPGTVHSTYGGAVFLEVQQSSDTTYRLHDWGRKDFSGRPRQLDIDKALGAIDFYSMGVSKYKPQRILGYSYKRKLLIKCEKFTMELMDFAKKKIKEKPHLQGFRILTVVKGKGKFHFGKNAKHSIPFKLGHTYLIPAHLGEYYISSTGNCNIVCSYVV